MTADNLRNILIISGSNFTVAYILVLNLLHDNILKSDYIHLLILFTLFISVISLFDYFCNKTLSLKNKQDNISEILSYVHKPFYLLWIYPLHIEIPGIGSVNKYILILTLFLLIFRTLKSLNKISFIKTYQNFDIFINKYSKYFYYIFYIAIISVVSLVIVSNGLLVFARLLLFFLSYTGFVIFFYLIFGKFLEFFLFFTLGFIISIVYLFSLNSSLEPAIYLHYMGLVLFLSSMFIIYKRNSFPQILNKTQPFYLFFILIFISFYFYDGLLFTNWDEFTHWGLATKEIFLRNKLINFESIVGFKHYPPASNLFHYYVIKNVTGSFKEGSVYFAHFILLLAPFMPLFKRLTNKSALGYIVTGITIFYLLNVLGNGFKCLYVDHILAVHFAMIILCYFLILRKKNYFLLLFPNIFILPILKPVGFLLACFILLIIFTDKIFNHPIYYAQKKLNAMKRVNQIMVFLICFFIFASAPLISRNLWNRHVERNKFERVLDIGGYSLNKLSNILNNNLSGEAKQTKEKFIKALFSNGISTIKENNIFGWKSYSFPFSVWFLIISILFSLLILKRKSIFKLRLGVLYFNLSLALFIYLAGLLYIYLYVFGSYEGPRLASFSRYINIFMLGFSLIAFILFIKLINLNRAFIKNPIKLIFFILLFNLYVFATPITDIKDTDSYGYKVRGYLSPMIDFIKNKISEKDRIYIIYQRSDGFEHRIIRYELSPNKSGEDPWSLGDSYFIGDVWTNNFSPEKFKSILEEKYDYLFIAKADDKFRNKYGDLFERPFNYKDIFLWKINKILNENNNEVLIPAE